MGIKDTVEYLYLCFMAKWEKTAPPDQHKGLLDGEPERNTQISRFAYIIRKIAAGQEDRIYNALQAGSSRRDGNSSVSKDSSWMKEPYPLSNGWYFEGCTNINQKHEIIRGLSKVGCSVALIDAIEDFVSGKSISSHLKLDEKTEERLHKIVRDDPDVIVK